MTLAQGCARVSGRSTRAALAARPEQLFAAGAIDASQVRRGSRDLRAQTAGIEIALAEATQTSPLPTLDLAVEKDTTSRITGRDLPRGQGQGHRHIGGRGGASGAAERARRFEPDLIDILWPRTCSKRQ